MILLNLRSSPKVDRFHTLGLSLNPISKFQPLPVNHYPKIPELKWLLYRVYRCAEAFRNMLKYGEATILIFDLLGKMPGRASDLPCFQKCFGR